MRPVNLIPPEERRGASRAPAGSTGSGVYLFLGGLGLAVLAVLLIVLTGNKVKTQEAELAKLKAEKAVVTEKAADGGVASDAAFELAAQARFDAVHQKAVDRFNFERRLRQLTRILPDNVKLKTLTGTLSGDAEATTGASSGNTDPGFALDMCIIGGGDPWPQLADLITRMRNLDGVDKVTGDKTSRPAEGSDTGAGASAAAPAAADGAAATPGATGEAAGPCSRPKAFMVNLKVSFEPPGAAAAADTGAPQTATAQAQGAASTASTANTAAGADGAAPAGASSP